MTPRILNGVCVGIGAALGYLFGDWLDRRRAERRTLTAADQQWMAATHDKGTDG